MNKTFVPTFKEKYNSDNEAFSDFENANFDDDIGNIAVYSKPDFLDSNCRFPFIGLGVVLSIIFMK